MKYSAIFFIGLFQISGCSTQCPPNVGCISTLDRHSCPENKYYREGVKSLKCCPGCVKLAGKGQRCNIDADCAPGLKCHENEKRCTNDSSQSCDDYKLNDSDWTVDPYWQPDCLPNGLYAPKQCKGSVISGKCFCTDERGGRILGERKWLDAGNMTCECSKMVNNLRKKGQGLSLHCDENGNFEELQCEEQVCWCSNERTGTPYTPVVPETMITILPCFDKKFFGSQYLRQCESMLIYSQRALKLLKAHGTSKVILPSFACDYDGSYSRVQRFGANTMCVYKDNKTLTYPTSDAKDCNCAYDSFVAKMEEEEFHLLCNPSGNYEEIQIMGGHKFRVDRDGFPHSMEPITSPRSWVEEGSRRS